jgi:cytidyltransferase-like protein
VSNRVCIFGAWDLFHVGHLRAIQTAKANGDYLIVGAESDDLVTDGKGTLPVIAEEQRAEIIRAIQGVNEVFIYNDRDYLGYLLKYNINILMWNPANREAHHQALLWELAKHNIQKIDIAYTKEISTTLIKNRIIENYK